MERVYIKYHPSNNLPNNQDILDNQKYNNTKSLGGAVFFTNNDNLNITPSQKDIIFFQLRLGHIVFQHMKWLVYIGRMKFKLIPR